MEIICPDTGTRLPSQYTAAIEEIASYFDRRPGVDALLLTGSWARGKGDLALGADCDLTLLHNELFDLQEEMVAYEKWENQRSELWQFDHLGPYSFIDLHPHDGRFVPGYHGFTSGPDDFELEIGNTLVYARPILYWTDRLQQLQKHWLPYYGEDLRAERLAMVTKFAQNNLNHIPPYSQRDLYFQCLKRLHHALEETLQALFIAASRYPIAYDKWIEEQVSEILGKPELYSIFVQVVTIPQLDAQTLQEKATLLYSVLASEIGSEQISSL
jgi:hypothetical protein